MKNIAVFLSAILFFLATTFILAGAEAPKDKPFAFITGPIFDFKQVVEGNEVVHDFILQNKGTTPLKIVKLKSG